MCGRTPEPALFRAICAIGILSVLQVEFDLVEPFLADKILAFRAQVAAIDDGIDELVWVGFEIAATLDPPDALEAQSVPYAA